MTLQTERKVLIILTVLSVLTILAMFTGLIGATVTG